MSLLGVHLIWNLLYAGFSKFQCSENKTFSPCYLLRIKIFFLCKWFWSYEIDVCILFFLCVINHVPFTTLRFLVAYVRLITFAPVCYTKLHTSILRMHWLYDQHTYIERLSFCASSNPFLYEFNCVRSRFASFSVQLMF